MLDLAQKISVVRNGSSYICTDPKSKITNIVRVDGDNTSCSCGNDVCAHRIAVSMHSIDCEHGPHPHSPMFGEPRLPSWLERFRPHQWSAIEEAVAMFKAGKKIVLVNAPTGCHTRGQKIMMMGETLKKVEDIEIGDELMGPDGKPRRVICLIRGRGKMVNVTPNDDGKPWRVNTGHIITLMNRTGRMCDIPIHEYVKWPTSRKQEWKMFRMGGGRFNKFTFKLIRTGEDFFYGFTLDGDGRYMLPDMTVTHNSGKGVIAETTRRLLDVRKSIYVCDSIQLQHQFKKDFPYAALLNGRSNYPTLNFPEKFKSRELTAAHCMKSARRCPWCHDVKECPYEAAKRKALASDISVINMAYYLAEANSVGRFSDRDFVVIDEADTIEQILTGNVSVKVTERMRRKYGISKCSISMPRSWARWIGVEVLPSISAEYTRISERYNDTANVEKKTALIASMKNLSRIISRFRTAMDSLDKSPWVAEEYSNGTVEFKPVTVQHLADHFIFRHAKNFLLMSATFLSKDSYCDDLGLDPAQVGYIDVPSTFSVEKRPIYVNPVANIVRKSSTDEYVRLKNKIEEICEKYPTERIIIHTVSYKLTQYLEDSLDLNRPIIAYSESRGKMDALKSYEKLDGAVLLAPSMRRGVDLKDDLARVCIIAKIPFLSLGDKQVKERMKYPGGQAWYTMQMIRDLVQSTGRVVRSADDWGDSYILDKQFVKNVWSRHRHLLPKWWKDAVIFESCEGSGGR